MPRGTNLPAVGGFNQSVILDLIRRHPDGVSRVEISEMTGLAPQTISNASKRLLEDGLIREGGRKIQGRGKPRVILELIPQSRFAVGVHLDPTVITYVVLDLQGSVVAHRRARTPSIADPDEVVVAISESVAAIIDEAGVNREQVLGIGIASPGPIDLARGVVVDPPLLEGWRNVPLRDSLAHLTGMPVVLEKDVNAAVVAELWTHAETAGDVAFFYLGTGIGIGLAIDGEVIRGVTGNAGDGGTLVVPARGLPPRRRSEKLGHLATPQYLVSQAVDEGVLAEAPDPHDLAAIDDAFSMLVDKASAGNEEAERILDRAAGFIASALVSVINLLDVDEIIFGGPAWARLSRRMRPEIAQLVADSPDRTARRPVGMVDSRVGEDVAAVGAACLVLDARLTPRPSTLLITS
ncbi:putative NBD/HSP70 family sugar kinase [Agromyces cerinus]|uniref:ROK family transcriptional regulator n=1 Tax=Agromyces cerinus TaxID=33878 RepID=UPI00195EE168|nr:ROK family transcriptional regulator [Agromyces cerinus]MBM7831266.1 putative NBD/HSP70 family sugar kinase [Agromyces cerinus]